MTNLDRAAELLIPNRTWCEHHHKGEAGDPCGFCEYNAQTGAERLADAGLLAPDLPEPVRAWNDDEAPLMWKITDDFNSLAVVVEERLPDTPVQLETFNHVVKRLTVKQARRAAHALLAAVDEAKRGRP